MNSNILSLLGLALRGGRLAVGEEPAALAAKSGQARLLLAASDAAGNTLRRAEHLAQEGHCLWLVLPFSKAELGGALGRGSAAVAALTDTGLAAAVTERLARLEALADELDRTGEEARRLELDGELHAELLRLPGNALFTGLIPLVIDFFRQLRPEPKTQLTRERIGREHRDIIAALRGGDTEHLVRLLGSHIEIYFTERSDDDGAAAR